MTAHNDAAGIEIKVGDKVVSRVTAGIYEVEALDNEASNIIAIVKNVKGELRRRTVYTFH